MISKPDIDIIAKEIAPKVKNGDLSLLLGAGYSINNPSNSGKMPSGADLANDLYEAIGLPKTGSLKDAYLLAKTRIPNFDSYLKDKFTATAAFQWQIEMFRCEWKRIYSTNIDNVLELAYKESKKLHNPGPECRFLNYTDPNNFSTTMGCTPVISLHGTINRLSDGFIFNSLEYGLNSSLSRDWMNDLATRITDGGVIVIGNRLDEADIDAALARRNTLYGNETRLNHNWIVGPQFDDIKKMVYEELGYKVITATGEEFFVELLKEVSKISSTQNGDIRGYNAIPTATRMWFREAFKHVPQEIESSKASIGIVKRFLNGAYPSWYYIVNSAYATMYATDQLLSQLITAIDDKSKPFQVIQVIGPSGCGKTTNIMNALKSVSSKYPAVYEYDSINGLDAEQLAKVAEGINDTVIFAFYQAYEFYYAIEHLEKRLSNRSARGNVVVILEDRTSDYRANKRHTSSFNSIVQHYEVDHITDQDALLLVDKMTELGIKRKGFSEKPKALQAKEIVDKERGFGGDLLSTMFSITTGDDFKEKILEEYYLVSRKSKETKSIIDYTAICSSFGLPLPIQYLSGFTGLPLERVNEILSQDLDGVLVGQKDSGRIICRHKIIAEFYTDECISRNGDVSFICSALRYLSTKFSVIDIPLHPLPYQIYKNIINSDFLLDRYFPLDSAYFDSLAVYNELQHCYSGDGIFWAHYGRLYLKGDYFDEAIECFKTGLEKYNSFQTRHLLGMAYLKRYSRNANAKISDLESGVLLLEQEHAVRLRKDPFPISTLCDQLINIRNDKGLDKEFSEKLRKLINEGIQLFRGDEYFTRVVSKY